MKFLFHVLLNYLSMPFMLTTVALLSCDFLKILQYDPISNAILIYILYLYYLTLTFKIKSISINQNCKFQIIL